MINLLFKSRIWSDFLQFFFSNPEGAFYGRELARKIGTFAGIEVRIIEFSALAHDGFSQGIRIWILDFRVDNLARELTCFQLFVTHVFE